MSKQDKLLVRMRNNPHDWRISELLNIAQQYGISVRNNGGSHYVFEYPGIEEDICIPSHRPIKAVYVRHFLALISQIEELNNND